MAIERICHLVILYPSHTLTDQFDKQLPSHTHTQTSLISSYHHAHTQTSLISSYHHTHTHTDQFDKQLCHFSWCWAASDIYMCWRHSSHQCCHGEFSLMFQYLASYCRYMPLPQHTHTCRWSFSCMLIVDRPTFILRLLIMLTLWVHSISICLLNKHVAYSLILASCHICYVDSSEQSR